MNHSAFLDIACEEAAIALNNHESPAGAVLAKGEDLVSRSHDRSQALNDPIAVAEMDCIRRAGRRNDQPQLTLYSTRYPDMLTAGTVLQFSIGAVVIGLSEIETPSIQLLREKSVPVEFVPHAGCLALEDGDA